MKNLKHLKTFENFDAKKEDAASNIATLASELGIKVSPEAVEDFVANLQGPELQDLASQAPKEEEPVEESAENVNEGFLDVLSQWWAELGNYQHTSFNSGMLTIGLTIAFLFIMSVGGSWLHTKASVKKYIIKEAERLAKAKGLDKTKMPDAVFKKALKDIVAELKANPAFMEKAKKFA